MPKKVKLKLLVGVREVHVRTYPIEIDVTDIPQECRPMHMRDWRIRERATKESTRAVEAGEVEALNFEFSHIMEPHTWSFEEVDDE